MLLTYRASAPQTRSPPTRTSRRGEDRADARWQSSGREWNVPVRSAAGYAIYEAENIEAASAQAAKIPRQPGWAAQPPLALLLLAGLYLFVVPYATKWRGWRRGDVVSPGTP